MSAKSKLQNQGLVSETASVIDVENERSVRMSASATSQAVVSLISLFIIGYLLLSFLFFIAGPVTSYLSYRFLSLS